MPSHQEVLPDILPNPVHPIRIVNPVTVSGVIAVTLFFATEAIAGAFALVWAVSGLMHLAPAFALALYGLAGLAALAATAKVAMLAWAAETDPTNNSPDGNVQPATAANGTRKETDRVD